MNGFRSDVFCPLHKISDRPLFISKNWQGILLIREAVMVELISATKTGKGLTVTWVHDTRTYETGKEVPDEEFHKITNRNNTFLGDLNYTLFSTMP
jgi:hypothetical protein